MDSINELVSGIENININKEEECNKECIKKIMKGLNNLENSILAETNYQLHSIIKAYPPAKNENKFTYGKLIEFTIYDLIKNFTECEDLDEKCKVGSSYKYDCKVFGEKISIKGKKNKTNTTLINKSSNNVTHNIESGIYMIVVIESNNIYIFPGSIIKKEYIKESTGRIDLKCKFLTYLEKHHSSEYIFKLPELNAEYIKHLSNICPININEIAYKILKTKTGKCKNNSNDNSNDEIETLLQSLKNNTDNTN